MIMLSHQIARRCSKGFSLVESVIAIAIVAIAVLTLVGLLPSGLEDLRRSSLKQAEARIIQAFVADYQMKSWGSAGADMTLQDKELYFDIRGTQVPDPKHIDHAITARASVDAQMPILSGDQTSAKHLRRLTIKITDQIQNPNAFNDEALHKVRSAWIANFDQADL